MSEKTTSIIKEIGDVFVAVFRFLQRVINRLIEWVKTWQWSVIKKIIGIVLVVATAFAIAIETIVVALMLLDPNQVAAILQSKTGLYLFDYITYLNYYGFLFGGFVLDIVFLTLVMWLGLWWWKGWNLFNKPRGAWWYAITVALVGFALLLGSIFYMIPGLERLCEDMPEHVTHKHHRSVNYDKPHNQYPNTQHIRYYTPEQLEYYSSSREAKTIFDQINRNLQQFDRSFETQW